MQQEASGEDAHAGCGAESASRVPASQEPRGDDNMAARSLDTVAREYDGVEYDFTDDGEYAIVIDPERSAVHDELVREIETLELPVDVGVKTGCLSFAQLNEIRARVEAIEWPGEMRSMTTEISPSVSKVLVMVSDADFGKVLAEEFGEDVQVGVGTASLMSRESDDQPHYGGARIWRGSQDGQPLSGWCSTGFKMQYNGSANTFMTTAGHCSLPSWNWRSGNPQGVSYLVGTAGTRSHFPGTDIIALNASGQTYRNRVYVSPEQYSRDVTASRNAVEGESVCQSGVTSELKCGFKVRDRNTTLTSYSEVDGAVVTISHLSRARYDDAHLLAAAPGDSGGPVFSKVGGTDAEIHGSITGGTPYDPPGTADDEDCRPITRYGFTIQACPVVFFSNIEAIESALGAQVSTS